MVSEVGRGRGSDRRSGEQKAPSVCSIAPPGGCPGCHTNTPDKPLWSSVWMEECVCSDDECLSTCVRLSQGVCGALESAVLSAAPSRCEAELLEVGDSVEVHERSRDHQDVEQLVRVELGTRRRDLLNACEGQRDRQVRGRKKRSCLPRCRTSLGRTSRGCGRRTDRLR